MCVGDYGRFSGKAFCTWIPKTSLALRFTCLIVFYAKLDLALSSINSKTSGFLAIKASCLGVISNGFVLVVLEMAEKHRSLCSVLLCSLLREVKPRRL